MEREAKVFSSPAEAAEAERRAMWALTVAERMEIARVLRERVYGTSSPDVRASHRLPLVDPPPQPPATTAIPSGNLGCPGGSEK